MLKHWNETSTYKHGPKLQSRVLSLATVIMLASTISAGNVSIQSASRVLICCVATVVSLSKLRGRRRTVSLKVEALSHDRPLA